MHRYIDDTEALITAMFVGLSVDQTTLSRLMHANAFQGGYIEFFSELVHDIRLLTDLKILGWAITDGDHGVFDYEVTEEYIKWFLQYTETAENTPMNTERHNKILRLSLKFFDQHNDSTKFANLISSFGERISQYV